MLTAYTDQKNTITFSDEKDISANLNNIIWVDMNEPNREEELFVERLLNTSIPTREEMHEIELSNRLYLDQDNLYATASILKKADKGDPEIHAITFVIVGHRLITLRYSNPRPFKTFIKNFHKSSYIDGLAILSGLQEAIVNRIADLLEITGHHIDSLSNVLFRAKEPGTKTNFDDILRTIGSEGDLVSKSRESLISVSRLVSFLSQTPHYKNDKDSTDHFLLMLRDIQALSDHAAFMNSKISFLLDATLGMVSIEQNAIIKIFSVAAVIFLPPTLVASIYGMNFEFMPELKMHFGYPLAILMMLLSAFVPYKFFKKKGWL